MRGLSLHCIPSLSSRLPFSLSFPSLWHSKVLRISPLLPRSNSCQSSPLSDTFLFAFCQFSPRFPPHSFLVRRETSEKRLACVFGGPERPPVVCRARLCVLKSEACRSGAAFDSPPSLSLSFFRARITSARVSSAGSGKREGENNMTRVAGQC